jgi:hypothetical protein
MTIRIRGLVCNNNGGDGIRIEGDVPLDAKDIRAEGNGGQGLNIIRHAGLLEQLGLPKETDPHALAELLKLLQSVPSGGREQVVRSSSILQKLGRFSVDASTLVSNIVSLSTNPAVLEIIRRLSIGA